jgi:MoaA/NifB/PqqE/SkfB family radical SAM enzyme
MCFNWQIVNKSLAEELSLAEIDNFTKTMGRIPAVTIGGGEPFVREDLPQICRIFFKNNQTKKISIPTNCLLPERIIDSTRKILDLCPIKLKVVLSLDGIGRVHDDIRGVQGNFDKFLTTLKRLTELSKDYDRLQINVNTTISNKNQNNVPQIIDFIEKNPQIKLHTLETIRGSYDPEKISAPPYDIYKKLIKKIISSKTRDGNQPDKAVYSYYHKFALDTLIKKEQIIPCRVSSFMPTISATGDVYHCELLPAIGNLRNVNYDFWKIWRSAKSENQRKNILQKKCHCTHYCYQIQNIPMSPPHLFKALFRKPER